MLFTELAVQNILGFPAAARIALGTGLNALVSPEADALELLRAVLFPEPGDASLAAAAGARRAALTIEGMDGSTWRLVRDFSGGRSLLRADPHTRKPVRVSDDPDEVARLLGASVGLPARTVWRHHLCLAAADLPSAVRATPRPAAPAVSTDLREAGRSFPPEEAARLLPDLRAELEKAVLFEHSQDALYALQHRRAEVVDGLHGLADVEEQIAELNGKIARFGRVREATVGLEERIRGLPELEARRQGALQELARRRREVEEGDVARPEFADLARSPVFFGGLAAGLACVAAAYVLRMRWLWALDIPGFGAAAFEAWRWVGRAEDTDRARQRLQALDELRLRVQRQYDLEAAPVASVVKELGFNSSQELVQSMEELDGLEASRVALVRELESRRAQPDIAALLEQQAALERELHEREAAVNAMGFSRDSGSIRREVEQCEEVLGTRAQGGAEQSDPLAEPIDRAAALARTDPRTLLDGFRDRISQYLSALTDHRWTGVRAGTPGPYLVAGASGMPVPMSALPPPDRDLVWIATRLALAERVAAPAALPLVVDDPSLLAAMESRGLLVRMLHSLGSMTQVVVRAREEPPASVVDRVARPAAARKAGA